MTEEFLDVKMAIDTFKHTRNKDKEYRFKGINLKKPISFAEFELYSPFRSNRLRQLEVHQTMSYIINDALVHGTHD